MTTLSKHYCKDPILPLYWHRNWLKKLIVIRLMLLQYLFESCLSRSSGPKRFLIILIRDFAVIASREFQLYLSLSYLFTFLYHTWIVICNTGTISKPPASQPKCVWWIPSLPGFCRLKVCWNCFDQTPSQVNKNVQKRSVISTALLGLQDTISWMFVDTSSNKSTFKVFYYKYETKFNANILYLKVWRRRLKWKNYHNLNL